jgi:hypothetical protein
VVGWPRGDWGRFCKRTKWVATTKYRVKYLDFNIKIMENGTEMSQKIKVSIMEYLVALLSIVLVLKIIVLFQVVKL